MDSKKLQKSVGRFIGWLGLSFCSLILKFVPARQIYNFSRQLSFLAFRIAVKQRRNALESLNIAFAKEKTAGELKQIAKDCFTFMAKSGVELLFLTDRPELLRQKMNFEGKENLDKALSKGKGVILVSAHFGNFPLMLARLSLEGYKTGAIMRPMRDKRVEKIFLRKRSEFNIKTIYSQPRFSCVNQTLEALRNNELIFIPLDQNFGTAGVFVDFFGKKAATATGPVILAQRTEAAILPCFIIRQPDDTHKIVFEPAMELEKNGTAQERIFKDVQKVTGIIEKYIRKYPAEWGWIHRRWKSRPR